MSGDADEEDDDFAPPPNHQQHVPVRILIMHGDFDRLVLRLTYRFCNLVDLCIEYKPVKRETPADQENGGKIGRNRSGHRGLSKCFRGC